MSITIIAAFEVADSETFLKVFAAAESVRSEAGIKAKAYRRIDASNRVYAIGTAPSKEAFVAFFSSPESAERMKNGGVISQPEVTMLEDV